MLVNIDEIKEGEHERAWDLAREAVDELVRGDNAGYRGKGPLHIDGSLRKLERRVFLEAHARASLVAPCGRCLSAVAVEVPLDFEMSFVPDEEVRPRDGGGPATERARGGGKRGRPRDDEESPGRHPGVRFSRTFVADEVNEETYSGKVIDLGPVIREQLLLALPGYPVCQEECKGLCSVCGANLNERDCGCDRRVTDPRWAALQKLRAEASPAPSTEHKGKEE